MSAPLDGVDAEAPAVQTEFLQPLGEVAPVGVVQLSDGRQAVLGISLGRARGHLVPALDGLLDALRRRLGGLERDHLALSGL